MKSKRSSDVTPYRSILKTPSKSSGNTGRSSSKNMPVRKHTRLSSETSNKSMKNVSFFSSSSNEQDVMTPKEALFEFSSQLSKYERKELSSYKRIYYFPHSPFKGRSQRSHENFGFSKDGVYQTEKHDHVAYRYEVLDLIDQSHFSSVYRAFDHKYQELVALKIIINQFKFYEYSQREIEILNVLNRAKIPGVVELTESFTFRGHRVMVFPLLHVNLFRHIKEKRFRGLPLEEVKSISQQILTILKLIHHQGVIHCDLKPENIMLVHEGKTDVNLIDFGVSTYHKKLFFSYVQSRHYRAPEVILGCQYTMAIDIWSFGCILVEMIHGFPPFTGNNEHQQLLSIMEYRGYPHKNVVSRGKKSQEFFSSLSEVKVVPDSMGALHVPSSKNIRNLLPNVPILIDLVEACLDMNPVKRINTAAALRHPFFSSTFDKKIHTRAIVLKSPLKKPNSLINFKKL